MYKGFAYCVSEKECHAASHTSVYFRVFRIVDSGGTRPADDPVQIARVAGGQELRPVPHDAAHRRCSLRAARHDLPDHSPPGPWPDANGRAAVLVERRPERVWLRLGAHGSD